MPDIEITQGFLMFWGGIAGAAVSVILAVIYNLASVSKAKKMLKKINEEDQ
ncbi:hypothetical protein [Ruminococcus sp.]|uniref:hypothetical protein n=1 Tax=Ruminococcus sp. TaxID=41978 RepID=UPI0025F93CC0|nr:hypothetical protein [Ruminococcus sp.]MBR1432870.1 hypothetical protein [Ruminococcus sp.]